MALGLQGLLDRDSNLYVGRLFDDGYSRLDILTALQERYPGETYRTYASAIDRGQQANGIADLLNDSASDYTLAASDIPLSGPTRGDYRYSAILEFGDAATGQTRYRTVVLRSRELLQRDEAYQSVLDAAENAFDVSAGPIFDYSWLDSYEFQNLVFTSVDRAYP